MQTVLRLAAKARAGLRDGALTGVLGRRRGPAKGRPAGVGGRPAGVGGGRPDPREVGEPRARSGPAGSTAASEGWPGDALPDSPSPSRVPPHLRLPFRRDSYEPHRAAASNYCRKSSASRRGAPLDAPPRGPVDWPVRSHVTVVLLPELGGLGARVRSERKPHPPILAACGPIVVPFDSPCWRCPGRLAETIWLATVSGRPLRTYRPPRRRAAASKDTRWSYPALRDSILRMETKYVPEHTGPSL
ncbi:uncharacterized protein LOC128119448 [Peromyscus californicus insignis]|uniref:uncharacterized protein LOC128119448 n=1 Tax=Peromyscus californicus insignis TaxID=564181 RepID=UPI0022A7C94F|nr:uncharacterized protein LOC128119448 [Peromyscus californicus insignis]